MEKEVRISYTEHQAMLETMKKQDKIIGQLLQDKEKEFIFIERDYVYDRQKRGFENNEEGILIPRIYGEEETAKMLDSEFRNIESRLGTIIRERDHLFRNYDRDVAAGGEKIMKLLELIRKHCNRKTFKKITGYQK